MDFNHLTWFLPLIFKRAKQLFQLQLIILEYAKAYSDIHYQNLMRIWLYCCEQAYGDLLALDIIQNRLGTDFNRSLEHGCKFPTTIS